MDALVRAGFTVQVIEAAPAVGGLGRSVEVGGEDVEAYYHHIFPQDHETRALIDRLGETTEQHRALVQFLVSRFEETAHA